MKNLTDFVFFQSPNISYNNPVINVFLKPDYLDINEVIKDKDVYMLTSGEVEDVTLIAENVMQGFGLNFERSYCSKAYYDYYRYLDLLERELSKKMMHFGIVFAKNEYGKNLVLKAQNQHYFRFKNIEITTKNVLLKNTKKGLPLFQNYYKKIF